jgi:hypothetical protein
VPLVRTVLLNRPLSREVAGEIKVRETPTLRRPYFRNTEKGHHVRAPAAGGATSMSSGDKRKAAAGQDSGADPHERQAGFWHHRTAFDRPGHSRWGLILSVGHGR